MTTFVVLRCDECQRVSGVARPRDDVALQGWMQVGDDAVLCPTCAWVAGPPALHWNETEGEK